MTLSIRRSVSLAAPAKINLFLRVVDRRSNGYHNLQTWMQKIDLADQLVIGVRPGRGIRFSCDDPAIPDDGGNLAVRAAEAFFAASRRVEGCGVDLHLHKNIPVAAGLGGGSSDAGTVLRGLNALCGDEFSEDQLLDIARPLGADVPFFALADGAVLAEGIGDQMRPLPALDQCTFVLVNPGFSVSTARVFQNYSLTRPAKNSKLPRSEPIWPLPETLKWLENQGNDLEAVTGTEHPEIDQMKNVLLASGAVLARMSGSGPTVFGIFPDASGVKKEDLQRMVDVLRRQYGGKVYVTRAVTGASPSGKAPGFDPGIRRFESCRPSHP